MLLRRERNRLRRLLKALLGPFGVCCRAAIRGIPDINTHLIRSSDLRGCWSLMSSAMGSASARHSVHRASELRKDTVASRIRDAAPVLSDELIENGAALRETLERADLVSAPMRRL
jgi:hypothetical protein